MKKSAQNKTTRTKTSPSKKTSGNPFYLGEKYTRADKLFLRILGISVGLFLLFYFTLAATIRFTVLTEQVLFVAGGILSYIFVCKTLHLKHFERLIFALSYGLFSTFMISWIFPFKAAPFLPFLFFFILFSIIMLFLLFWLEVITRLDDLKFSLIPPQQISFLLAVGTIITWVSLAYLTKTQMQTPALLAIAGTFYVFIIRHTNKNPFLNQKYGDIISERDRLARQDIDLSTVKFFTPYPLSFATNMFFFGLAYYACWFTNLHVFFPILMAWFLCQITIAFWSKKVYEEKGTTYFIKKWGTKWMK